jgi:2-dehydro-3-deoxygalactonokinase
MKYWHRKRKREMSGSTPTRELCVAIDGGTTNTRARLLLGSTLLATGTRNVGVRDAAIAGSTEPLHRAVADSVNDALRSAGVAIQDVALLCVSGMLTSNVGLQEVPHVHAPAGVDDLARGVVLCNFPAIAAKPIHFIPGVKTVPVSASLPNLHAMDVLRGEECEVFGILQAIGQGGPLCILLPGSHTKLLHIDSQSRITASYTTMGGELMQALAQHTILASSVTWPPPGEPVWSAVETGAKFAQEWGVARGAFAVRLADIMVGIERHERSWFLVGLIVGNDWTELAKWPLFDKAIPLLIGGREPLRSVLGHLSHLAPTKVLQTLDEPIVDIAAAAGAIRIATRRSVTA